MRLEEVFPSGTDFSAHDYDEDHLIMARDHINREVVKTIPLEGGSYELKITRDNYFSLFKKAEVVGWVKLGYRSIKGKKYRDLDIVYLVPSQRKTKAFYVLINAVKQEIKMPVLVDGAVFKDGVQALNAVSKREKFKLSVVDLTNGEEVPFDGTVPFDTNKGIVVEGFGIEVYRDYVAPGGAVSRQSFVLFE